MGYCTYTINKKTGGSVAAWIGTGTDLGKQVTVSYNKGATNKTAACNDVRNQFCKKFAPGGRCFVPSAPPKTSVTPAKQCTTGSSGLLVDVLSGKNELQKCLDAANKANPTDIWGNPTNNTGGGGGGGGGSPDTGVDADCNSWGPFKGLCVAGKSMLKGAQAFGGGLGIAGEVMPFVLLGGGLLAAFIILRR